MRVGALRSALFLLASSVAWASPIRQTRAHLPSAKDFYVDGAHIPGISNQTGDLGPSYAGLLPISANPNDDRKFFFWWWPHNGTVGSDDLVIWLNGGPGCSSLEGLLEENGPVTISSKKAGVTDAKVNPYSWHKLANTLWIEQPVSVGLGRGRPDIKDEHGVAKEFYGFLQNYFTVFPQLKGKKLWITGESYAGQYIPYIVDYIYKQKDTLNLQGFNVNDPSIVNDYIGEEIPSYQFALDHKQELGLNDSFVSHLTARADKLGVAKFIDQNLQFPPKGKILVPKALVDDNVGFWTPIYNAANDANACFSVYNIHIKCPAPEDPLGFSAGSQNSGQDNFINDTPGFKAYVHADGKTWVECTDNPVFIGNGGDQSPHPADTDLLGTVIEKSKRSVIQHGLLDYVLIANGTLLGIQNSTWHGQQGFQQAPSTALIVDGQKAGTYHTERGLTFAYVEGSGHMIPEDKPAVAYKLHQYLLGQIDEASLGH
ncbi:unnamed protein product [Parajaminaea phylloscopi]